jgi:integrative and conjugative element protein (TIGR02256 family)
VTTFVTADRRLGVVLDEDVRQRLVEHCIRAGHKETGGILIGRYSETRDQAIITDLTGPPPGSIRRRFSFVRGFAGLQVRLDRAWRQHASYLGEWHFHPFMAADPSQRDRTQITDFARDPAYACPEPILLVIGGDPAGTPEIQVAVVQQPELLFLLPSDRVNASAEPQAPGTIANPSGAADKPQ